MQVKICGITQQADALAAIRCGADLVGFIFVDGTPRGLDPEAAGWIRDLKGAATVGVFRNAPLPTIRRIRDALELDWVQLHGNEPDAWLGQLGERVIRRVAIPRTGASHPEPSGAFGAVWDRVRELQGRCLPLIDPGSGDGVTCDWRRLGSGPAGARYGLAGGLDPDSVGPAVELVRPAVVDVSSGVESARGIKDHARIRAFVDAARQAARSLGTGA